MEIVARPLDSLKPDPRNARRHSERNLAAIAASLSEFGQRRPLVVKSDGTILAGNGLHAAAVSLGWTSLDVTVVPDDWTEEQAVAFAIADNRTGDLSEWDDAGLLESLEMLDGDALLEAAGFDVSDLDDLRAEIDEDLEDDRTAGKTRQGERYTPSLADYAERYAAKTTRFVALDYPNEIYIWVVDRLAEARAEMEVESNAEAVLGLLESYFETEAPEWT